MSERLDLIGFTHISTDITISSATAAVPVQTHQVPAAAFSVMVSIETP